MRRDTPVWIRVTMVAAALLILVSFAHDAVGLGGRSADVLFEDWVYDAVAIACALLCLARGALIRDTRRAWLILGFGLSCDAAGEVLSSISESLAPGVQDALYLLFYLASYLAIVLLGRRGVTRFRASLSLDGVTGMLAVAAVAAAVVIVPGWEALRGSVLKTGLDIAYPLTDALLVGMVILMVSLGRWRTSRCFASIAAGFTALALADGIYLYQETHGGYTPGTPLDALWLLAALTLALAAWQPDSPPVQERESSLIVTAAPAIFGATAIGVLVYANVSHAFGLSIWLAVAALMSVLTRLVITASENIDLLATSTEQANRDALTGLGNRRALLRDLELAASTATPESPRLLLLFDLNGFKRYNDTFGHPAGDALLRRLGHKLADRVRGYGGAYRLGGDEFCALIESGDTGSALAVDLAGALLESGEHFTIGTSYGEVLIGYETDDPEKALHIADQRLYAQKTLLMGPVRPEWCDVLMGLLRERDPELSAHVEEVAELALQVGRHLGLGKHDLRDLIAAAELHDIGKTAIPDAILEKPTALDEEERAFIERHTLIGERILAAAPTGKAVAEIVRSTHERFDGKGYPEGLAGEDIPLAARIIAICDAYNAMVSDRRHSRAVSHEQATEELSRCAGAQFDPRITRAFLETVARVGSVGESAELAIGADRDHRVLGGL